MPTYRRPNQRPLLVVQTQTLSAVNNIHLILIEDSKTQSLWIQDLLKMSQLQFTHLACPKTNTVNNPSVPGIRKSKGSEGRNCGLLWLKNNNINDGVIYFADDDNFYDIRLFEEVRAMFAYKINI